MFNTYSKGFPSPKDANDRTTCICVKTLCIYIYMYQAVFVDTVCPEDPLPPPKVHRDVDSGRGDFELFQQYVLPSGGLCAIGDMWDDVA